MHHLLSISVTTLKTNVLSLKYLRITHRLSYAFQMHYMVLVEDTDYKHSRSILVLIK